MGYSLLNDRIQLYIDNERTGFNVLFDSGARINQGLQNCRSARQNPDLSRLELASLMRYRPRKQKKVSWDTFIAAHAVKNSANSNSQELS
jgi:hypothetical protein